MEEGNNTGDFVASFIKQSALRSSGSFKSSLSGRSTPRGSPSFKKFNAGRTPRREYKFSGSGVRWLRSNQVLFWLLLITLWCYLGFYVQSRWAHGENKEEFLGFESRNENKTLNVDQNQLTDNSSLLIKNGSVENEVGDSRIIDVVRMKNKNGASAPLVPKKRSKRSRRSLRTKVNTKKKTVLVIEEEEPAIPMINASFGMLVGPFGLTEDRILEWSPVKRSGTCDRKSDFARLVWSRRFILIFHELSLTGAPISMMELATELLSCGATVSAVVLSKRGGLMPELTRRKIKVLEDKADFSFKTAMKSDLIIAGSAVCASWIDGYIAHFPAGASQVAWWIMENRREYFDRSKSLLNRVKMLIFVSESQSKEWLNWCEEEKIKFRYPPVLVPLSVNDELAFAAGISCSLNTDLFSTGKMLEKRKLLRVAVRNEMGLADNDMLVMSLSSINPGKGQSLILESARIFLDQEKFRDDSHKKVPVNGQVKSTKSKKHRLKSLFQRLKIKGVSLNKMRGSNETIDGSQNVTVGRRKLFEKGVSLNKLRGSNETIDGSQNVTVGRRKLFEKGEVRRQSLKILIGAVGSKSTKVAYVKELLSFLTLHSNVSKSVLWTPATTRVASLYSAADVYIINSQGLGETFGRVTIEAMAFGLPVLGTDGGGTKEIVEHNVTGLLHPLGSQGTVDLAQNLRFLLEHPQAREQMGMKGRKKVKNMYLKQHMYKRFVEVIAKCMRPK